MFLINTDMEGPNRILIAEDFHADTEAFIVELKEAELNCSTCVVDTEAKFVAALTEFKPHIILSPYSLKDSNAIKLLGHARRMGCEAPFILIAFDLSEHIAIDLLAEGIEDYIQRSTVKRLPVAIKKALQRYRIQFELRTSEMRLRNSEISLRNMVRNAPIAVAMFDLNMYYLVVSEKWLEHENRTEEEVIGKSHYDIVPELPDAWKEIHRACLKGDTRYSERDEFARSNGKHEVIRWKMNPWYDADGEIGGVVLFIEDISQLSEAQQKLNEQRISRDLAIKASGIGVWHLILSSEVTATWDNRCLQLFGITDGHLSAEGFFDLLHPDDALMVRNKALDAFVTGNYEAEYRLLRDGEQIVISAKGRTSYDEHGNAIRLDGILFDITEQKAKEQSINTLSLVASETTNGVLIHDAMGKISWANRGFTEITGYTLEEAMGKEPWSFLSSENTDQGLIATTYQKMNEGQTFKSDNVLLTKDGRELWISTTFNPIMDENGQLKQVVSIGVDVTGQKQLEIEQRTLLNDLKKMNQELKKQLSS